MRRDALGSRLRAPRHQDLVQRAAASSSPLMRIDPTGSGRLFLTLPERRVGFQIIHQKLRRLKCRLPVLRCRQHQHDIFAGGDAADAMNHGEPVNGQRTSRSRMSRNFSLGHSGIMFECQRRDAVSASLPRQMPLKLTTAPISVRPCVSADIPVRCRNRLPECGW